MVPDEYDVVTRLRTGSSNAAKVTEFELRVVAGPDTGKVFLVLPDDPSRALIGTSSACSIRLVDAEASRRHASLEATGPSLKLMDLGSTNGTFVNGLRVFDVALAGGESIQIGSTVMNATPREGSVPHDRSASGFGPVIGASSAMRRLYPVFERLASSRVPVIIEGETGTGKELVAEALHRMGPRHGAPCAVFDCASVASGYVEEALFGREEGSGHAGVLGVFEQAAMGTLVIDEVGDLSLDVQAKLLRAIDRGEVRRVGASHPIHVDVRVIATTRRDLDAMVQAGEFREDLFFRLAVARIELPPLRKRLEDVPLLVVHFWKALQGLGNPPPDLIARLRDRPWPGNVRELQNVVARTLALGDGPLETSHTSASDEESDDVFDKVLFSRLPLPRARERVIDAFERAYVARALEESGGNVSRAAAASGLALRYFQVLKARQARTAPP